MANAKNQKILHKRSVVLNKLPDFSSSAITFGEIAINYNTQSPTLSIKTSNNSSTVSGAVFYDKVYNDSTYAAKVHKHSASDITSGTLAIDRIPTGTTSGTVATGNHTHTISVTGDTNIGVTGGSLSVKVAHKTPGTATQTGGTETATASTAIKGVTYDANGHIVGVISGHVMSDTEETAISASLNNLSTNKQDKLTAGTNITISGTVISSQYTDTATTKDGHYVPASEYTGGTTATTASSAIKGIKYDARGHVTEVVTGSVLTSFTETSITTAITGTGVVTGITTGGTKGHKLTLVKTTAVKVDSASTADSAAKLSASRTISLTGAVTGSVSTDLSGDVTIGTSVNHTHSQYALTSTTISAGSGLSGGGNLSTDRTISLGNVAFNNVSGITGTSSATIARGDHDHDSVYSKTGHTHSALTNGSYTATMQTGASGEIAYKSDIDSALAAAVNYKGTASAIPSSAKVGDLYIATTAITIAAGRSGTGAAQTAETGDFLICRVSGTTASKWDVIQKNIDGAVTTTQTLTANKVLLGNGNKTVKVSSYTIDASVPSGALFTDSACTETGHYSPTDVKTGTTSGERITGITTDSKGHITGIATATTSHTHTISTTGDTWIGLTGSSLGVKAAHQGPGTASQTGGTTTTSASTAIKGITIDSKGHIVGVISGEVMSYAEEEVISAALNTLNTGKQDKLTAGTNITISGAVISSTYVDTACTFAGHFTPTGTTTAGTSTSTAASAIKGIKMDAKGHVTGIISGSVLTSFTETSITTATTGTGVVTGITTGGTNGHLLTLQKAQIKMNSASTSDNSAKLGGIPAASYVTSGRVLTDVPANAVFTDTACTLNGHYAPSATKTGGTTTASASTAIKGIKYDAKGHITDVISGSVDVPMISTTWSELKTLRNASGLTAGQEYRITDYNTTVTGSSYSAAGHQFDVIVIADDTCHLNETARVCHHAGDTYFSGNPLEAWKINYCLDNNTNRFAWANTGSTGRGVIYYMMDEFGNECPYDFKNVLFCRKWNSNTSLWSTTATTGTSGAKLCYTFSSSGNSSTTAFTDYSIISGRGVYNNVIKEYRISSKKQNFNNNCFFGSNCHSNTFGYNCNSNTFGIGCYYNTFGNGCHSNIFGNGCYNTFGIYCYYNTFGNSCYNNAFENYCNSNKFGNNCNSNTFGNECEDNIFGNYCAYNTFGNSCFGNEFGNNCDNNAFGNYCFYNEFGNNCDNNAFGSVCVSNTFKNICRYNTFGNSCAWCSFGSSGYGNTLLNNIGYDGDDWCGVILNEGSSNNIIESGILRIELSGKNICNYLVKSSANNGIEYSTEISEYDYYNITISSINSSRLICSFEDGDGCYYENIVFTFVENNHGLYSWVNNNYGTFYTNSNSSTTCNIGDYGEILEIPKELIINAVSGLTYCTTVARKSNGKIVQYCEADLIADQD